MKVDTKLILFALSSVVVIFLGTLGFYQHYPENGFLTALYQSVQLFSMNSGVWEDPVTPISIEIARWVAIFTLIGIVYATVDALLGHLQSTARIAFAKGLVIICGAGQRGNVITRAFCKKCST